MGNRAQATVVNSTFNGNSAGYGGGIAVYGSPTSLQLHGGTLAGNTAFADQGGGLSVQFTATATLIDTIVAGNAGGDVIAALAPNSAANLIGDGTGMTGLINGANGNLIGTAATPINPMLGALADNGGPTKTLAILPGSPAINSGVDPDNAPYDQRGIGFARVVGTSADIGAFELQQAPRIQATQINDGSAQRSRVLSLSVTFSSQVSFATTAGAAFTLARSSDGAAVSFTATASVVNGVTVVSLNNFTGSATQSGSLADGRYSLTALAGQISAGGQALDGNGDGTSGDNYIFGDAQGLFRLFGDVNGDQTVNGFDFGFFKNAFGTQAGDPNYLSYLDINGDGVINGFDFGQFRTRFGTMLP